MGEEADVTTFEFGEESPVAPDEGGIGQDSELTENTDRRRLDVRTEDNVDDDTVTLSRIRQVLKSVEHAVYEWNIAEDTLHWGDNVGDLLPAFEYRSRVCVISRFGQSDQPL